MLRTGFDLDGRIVFQDIDANFLIGAYADIGARVVSKASYSACGPYRAQHARIVGARTAVAHHAEHRRSVDSALRRRRGPSNPSLNDAAAKLDIDPVEIRRRNLPAKGEAFIPNDTPADGDWNEALLRRGPAIGWGTGCASTAAEAFLSD